MYNQDNSYYIKMNNDPYQYQHPHNSNSKRCCCICPPCPPIPPGTCTCCFSGELVNNGDMESFTNNIPTGWTSTTPTQISQVTAQGSVHSGNSSVQIENAGILTQTISGITAGCAYEFSFFALGQGAQVGLMATVNFVTLGGDVLGGIIAIRQQDIPTDNRNFAYYKIFTTEAPVGVTGARIDFAVTANGEQSLIIDDVSLG